MGLWLSMSFGGRNRTLVELTRVGIWEVRNEGLSISGAHMVFLGSLLYLSQPGPFASLEEGSEEAGGPWEPHR